MDKILVLIPAYNEAQNIDSVLNELKNDFSIADVLVINDCSSDRTVSILKERRANYISTPFNMGYSGALQLGFKYAEKYNYDYVIQFDGDGQHIASEALKLYNSAIKNTADIVIGSRFIDDFGYKHSMFRKIGTGIFKISIKMICGKHITDPTSGFQILNRKVFSRYALRGEFPDYPDANLIIYMLLEGYKIHEIPVVMRERVYGESMHSGVVKPIKYMIKMFHSIFLVGISRIKYKIRGEIK